MVFRVTFKVLSVIKSIIHCKILIRNSNQVICYKNRLQKRKSRIKLEMILVNKFGKMVLFILESEKKLSQWL
ncbi:unnamed protein product [Paramecium sonneborni]|uniref:Uncharacterized protein n=1 Tax=Paramecium sonneborni TaxID=65129 RepID=A0A8S1P8K2_9CILI|nr:unnamed protein product [Paramecium sonneborni]